MGSIVTSQHCIVCDAHEPIMHSHHTTPQCKGGVNSPQVILCPTCHNLIHAHALHLVSCIRKNATPTKRFWRSERLESNAQRLVQLIVEAFLKPLPTETAIDIPLTFSVSPELKADLQLLQADLGLSSMEKTLVHCVKFTLQQKGIKNEQKPSMWFLPASNSRKSV